MYPLIHNEAVDIVNVSTATTGFTGCRQVVNMCYAYELPVSMMNCQANYMAHLAAALPNHLAMEVVDPGREHCLRFDNTIEDGFIVLGDAPGIGIEVDEEALPNRRPIHPSARATFLLPGVRAWAIRERAGGGRNAVEVAGRASGCGDAATRSVTPRRCFYFNPHCTFPVCLRG